MIRVFIVDDQTLVRDGLRRLLELTDDISVVGEAAGVQEAYEAIPIIKPDVILLDMRMPGGSAIDLLKQLRKLTIKFKVIVLTTFDDVEALKSSAQNGASGFLLKDVSFEKLCAAIKTVMRGGVFYQPTITDSLLASVRKRDRGLGLDEDTPSADLTPRELEILKLMAGGYANREIAEILALSPGTVKNHVSSILAKLDVGDRTRAVLRAISTDIV